MSDKIDKWVEKNPESWAKLATNTKQKETFDSFKKKLKIGAKSKRKIQRNKTHDKRTNKTNIPGKWPRRHKNKNRTKHKRTSNSKQNK